MITEFIFLMGQKNECTSDKEIFSSNTKYQMHVGEDAAGQAKEYSAYSDCI